MECSVGLPHLSVAGLSLCLGMSASGFKLKRYANAILAEADLVCRTWISPKNMPLEEMTAVGATLEMGHAMWRMSVQIVPKTKTDNCEAQRLLAVWPGTLHVLSSDDAIIVY